MTFSLPYPPISALLSPIHAGRIRTIRHARTEEARFQVHSGHDPSILSDIGRRGDRGPATRPHPLSYVSTTLVRLPL